MNVTKFIDILPKLYTKWDTADVSPIDGIYTDVKKHVQNMTSVSVMQLLNWANACNDGYYLEVGSFHGATTIGALLNRNTRGILVEDFSQFDPYNINHEVLTDNLRRYGLMSRVELYINDYHTVLPLLYEKYAKAIGVYFYDAKHDYQSTLDGMTLVLPLLQDQALMIIDDTNYPEVQIAVREFLHTTPGTTQIMRMNTEHNGCPSWWNGITLIRWGNR